MILQVGVIKEHEFPLQKRVMSSTEPMMMGGSGYPVTALGPIWSFQDKVSNEKRALGWLFDKTWLFRVYRGYTNLCYRVYCIPFRVNITKNIYIGDEILLS